MRTLGAGVAIGALAIVVFSTPPADAFGLRIGPLSLLPFIGHHHRLRPHATALHPATRPPGALFDKADSGALVEQPQQAATPAPLYPALALPTLYDAIFQPAGSAAWPFSYEAIFRNAFVKSSAAAGAEACQPGSAADAIAARIRAEVRPSAAQMPAFQKLVEALHTTLVAELKELKADDLERLLAERRTAEPGRCGRARKLIAPDIWPAEIRANKPGWLERLPCRKSRID